MWYTAQDDPPGPKVKYYQEYIAYPCQHCVTKRRDSAGAPCSSKPIRNKETTPCPSKRTDGQHLSVVVGRPCCCGSSRPSGSGSRQLPDERDAVAETAQTEVSLPGHADMREAFAPRPPAAATESFQASPDISEHATETVTSFSSAATSYQSLPKKPNAMTCPCPKCTSERCKKKSTSGSQTETDYEQSQSRESRSPKAKTVSQGHGTHTSAGCSPDELYDAYEYPYDLVTSELSEKALERSGSSRKSSRSSTRSRTKDIQPQRSSPDASISKKPSSTPRQPRSESRDAFTSPERPSSRRSISFDEEEDSDQKDDSRKDNAKKQQRSCISSCTQTRKAKSKRTQMASAEEYASEGLDEGYAQAKSKRKKKGAKLKTPKLKYLYDNSASKKTNYPTCPCSSSSADPPPSRASKMRAYASATIGQKMDYMTGLAKPPTCHQSAKSLVLEERCNVLHELAKVLDPEMLANIRPRHLKCFLSNYDLDALGFHFFCEANAGGGCKGKKRQKPIRICHCDGQKKDEGDQSLALQKGEKDKKQEEEDDDEAASNTSLEIINESDERDMPSQIDQHTSAPLMSPQMDSGTLTNPDVFTSERSTSPEDHYQRDVENQTQFNNFKMMEKQDMKYRSGVPSRGSVEENFGYDKAKCICCPNIGYKVSVKSQKCCCHESKGRRSIEPRPASGPTCCCDSTQTDEAVMNVRVCPACCRAKPVPPNARGPSYKDIFTAQQQPVDTKCACACTCAPAPNDGVPRKISASQMDIIDLVEAIRKKLSVDYGRCSCTCKI